MATAKREIPVLFSGEFVRALLDGTKTQTRRPIKPQPPVFLRGSIGLDSERMSDWIGESPNGKTWRARCPLGESGTTRLWVREAFIKGHPTTDGGYLNVEEERTWYRADRDLDFWLKDGEEAPVPWRPSIHMPRAAARILLDVTDVRVERVQDISEADACAEGMGSPLTRDCKKPKFAEAWDELYGKSFPWASNPYVWAVTFRRVQP